MKKNNIALGVVMDPLHKINFKKDSTWAMLLDAHTRDWEIHYFEQKDIFIRDGKALGRSRRLLIQEKNKFELKEPQFIALKDLNVILMRKDPPFDLEYIYSTFILEQAEREGVLVVNKPQSLRDANEKLFTSWFPQCTPPTLVTSDIQLLRQFYEEEQDIICKPLEGMGGYSIFRLTYPDLNASVVFEMLTNLGTQYAMAQRYIPEINSGDKRILLINGEPIPYALARIPAKGELRGNLAAGGNGIAKQLSEKDYWICREIAPVLQTKGLYFVGIDVIGDYLTEINVTSPTCIRELDEQCGLNIAAKLLDFIQQQFT